MTDLNLGLAVVIAISILVVGILAGVIIYWENKKSINRPDRRPEPLVAGIIAMLLVAVIYGIMVLVGIFDKEEAKKYGWIIPLFGLIAFAYYWVIAWLNRPKSIPEIHEKVVIPYMEKLAEMTPPSGKHLWDKGVIRAKVVREETGYNNQGSYPAGQYAYLLVVGQWGPKFVKKLIFGVNIYTLYCNWYSLDPSEVEIRKMFDADASVQLKEWMTTQGFHDMLSSQENEKGAENAQ